MEDLRIGAADVQRVVVLESGSKRIESGSSGRWRGAQHEPGTVSLTAPGRVTRLRWRATSAEPVVTVQVGIPGGTLRDAAGRLWGRAAPPELDRLDAGAVPARRRPDRGRPADRRRGGPPRGSRPYRVHIDPAGYGAEEVYDAGDRVRREFYDRIGLADLLTPRTD